MQNNWPFILANFSTPCVCVCVWIFALTHTHTHTHTHIHTQPVAEKFDCVMQH